MPELTAWPAGVGVREAEILRVLHRVCFAARKQAEHNQAESICMGERRREAEALLRKFGVDCDADADAAPCAAELVTSPVVASQTEALCR